MNAEINIFFEKRNQSRKEQYVLPFQRREEKEEISPEKSKDGWWVTCEERRERVERDRWKMEKEREGRKGIEKEGGRMEEGDSIE